MLLKSTRPPSANVPVCELSEHSEDIKYFEIVGNIFDNPKLLESEG